MDKYIVEGNVGAGNYGDVFLVRSKENGARFVVKKVDLSNKSPQQQRDAENEVRTMSKLQHPNIVGFIEAFVEAKVLHIIMEYADGSDLEKVLIGALKKKQPLTEEYIMRIFVQIALALRQLHKQHLLHRDLKSANCFLTSSGVVKLGDFGFSKQLNYTMALASTVCGTPYYFSPELCQKLPYNNKSDVWSLGVILYEMINLRKPFEAKNLPELRKRVVTEEPAPFVVPVSDDLKNLTMMLLRKSSSARPSVEAVLQVPFVRKFLTENFAEALQHQARDAAIKQQAIIEKNPFNPGETKLPPIAGAGGAAAATATPAPPAGASKRMVFSKEEMARVLKGEAVAHPSGNDASPLVAPEPPKEPPTVLHNRQLPQARDKVSVNAPLTVVGELTGAMLDQENLKALQDDVQEVLSSFDVDEVIGEAETDEEQMLRDELGPLFIKAIELAVELGSLDSESPQSELTLRKLLTVLGAKQYLLSDVQRVAAQFELND